ncbi:prepilin peptidase [Candidatus Saccharibacteria bacterium]|nr:prepilin peptidase [Candidatus Saccharibacteria bacterium]MCB9834792.1 prepilin peptidase [Candidatus Nomurabacteria bacterium]
MLIATTILASIFASFFVTLGMRVNQYIAKNQPIDYYQLLFGRSHCNACQSSLNPIQLIPIVGLGFYRGQCPKCKQKISWSSVGWEIVYIVGFTSLVAYQSYQFDLELALDLVFFSFAYVGVITDWYYRLLPDFVLRIVVVVGLLEFGLSRPAVDSVLWQLATIGSLILINRFTKERLLGKGDLWLVVGINLSLAGIRLMIAYLAAIYLATIVGLVGIVTRKLNLKSSIAFGPFLVLGWWIAKTNLVKFDWLIESLKWF